MAKIRAYKLAEEIGIDRGEIVEKAASVGLTLKSAMASIDDEDAEKIRAKFGEKREAQVVIEKRVTREGGSAVIRRRKQAVPEPPPEPEELPAPEPIAASEAPLPAVGAPEIEVPGEVVLPPPDEEAPPAIGEPATSPAVGPSPTVPERETARPTPGGGAERRDGKEGKQRKLVREVVNLREQERLARQATGRGPARRHVTIDPRAMTSPRRRRRDAAPPKPAAATVKEAKRVVRVEGDVSVGELARMLGAKAPEVQKKLMAFGTMVSINQSIGVEVARKVAEEFDYELQDVGFREQVYLEISA